MNQARRTCIVTHTGCDMTLERAKQLSIVMIPDIVIYEERAYLNGVELEPVSFYERLSGSSKLPTSSHPNNRMFMDAFCGISGCEEILCLTCTSQMSSTYSTACVSAQLVREEGFPIPVRVYDTKQVSHGMGLMVEEAARLADAGASAQEIIEALDAMQNRIGVYFMLETLKYAYKGGRTGAIGLLATDILGVRPILLFKDGTVRDIGILRNAHESLKAVAGHYKKEAKKGGDVIVFHGNVPFRAQTLSHMIAEIDPDAKLRTEFVGPVIGLYAGPGTAGVAFVKEQ